jgi:phage terminase large subunit-like protein
MAMLGLRIGSNPQAMIATTPRPIPLLRELIRSPTCVVTRATTFANRANLAPAFFEHIIAKYKGTRLGRQELEGDILEEAEGALWTREMVEQACDGRRSEFLRVVVGVDPAVSANASSALTGIVVAAKGHDQRAYVLADLSGRYSPDGWARVAIGAFRQYGADRIVAEGNQGGDLVRHTLSTISPNLPISIVHASRSKQARAEPVAALYEQRKVTHLAPFPELDDQLCTWEPLSGEPSPDRLDALVWALSDLMLQAAEPPIVMPFFTGVPRYIPGQ